MVQKEGGGGATDIKGLSAALQEKDLVNQAKYYLEEAIYHHGIMRGCVDRHPDLPAKWIYQLTISDVGEHYPRVHVSEAGTFEAAKKICKEVIVEAVNNRWNELVYPQTIEQAKRPRAYTNLRTLVQEVVINGGNRTSTK